MEKIRTKNGTWSAAHDVLRIKNQHISPRGPSEAWIRSIMGTNQKLSSDLSISFRHWEKPTNNFLLLAHRHPPPFKYLLARPNRRGRQQSHHLFLPYSSIQHICITALSRQLGSSPAWLTSRNMEQLEGPRHCFFTSMTAFLENSHVTCASQLFWFLCDVAANLDESEV